MVFDCLYARGKDLCSQPLYVRRNVIEDMLDGQNLVLPVRRLSDDGLKAWREAVAAGFEGRAHVEMAQGERGWEPKNES